MVPTHSEIVRYAKNRNNDDSRIENWLDHCRDMCREWDWSFDEALCDKVIQFWKDGEWPDEEYAPEAAMDALKDLVRACVERIIRGQKENPEKDWTALKELDDIYYADLVIRHIRDWMEKEKSAGRK